MEFVIGFIVICLLFPIEFQGKSSWASIKCSCIDRTGKSQILEEKQIFKVGEDGTLLNIAKDIYSRLPQNKYDIIFGYGDNITIKESLEYELANKVQNSERKR